MEEKCAENAARLGPIFREEVMAIGSPLIKEVGRCRCRALPSRAPLPPATAAAPAAAALLLLH